MIENRQVSYYPPLQNQVQRKRMYMRPYHKGACTVTDRVPEWDAGKIVLLLLFCNLLSARYLGLAVARHSVPTPLHHKTSCRTKN